MVLTISSGRPRSAGNVGWRSLIVLVGLALAASSCDAADLGSRPGSSGGGSDTSETTKGTLVVADDTVTEDGTTGDDTVTEDGTAGDDTVTEDGTAGDDTVTEDGTAGDDAVTEDGTDSGGRGDRAETGGTGADGTNDDTTQSTGAVGRESTGGDPIPPRLDFDDVELSDPAPIPAGITVTNSLPVPQNVRAFPGDEEITVTWDPVNHGDVVGYYITYRVAGSNDEYLVRQQKATILPWGEFETAIQLQPLQNGVAYEIGVQSASGRLQRVGDSTFARADGRVSPRATTVMAPSDARVRDMRQRLTGFFDDFDQPMGPFDERRWNHAVTNCVKEGTAGAFVNDQSHVHNMLATQGMCDRAGIFSRPRAVFDTTGATAADPAIIEFDIDGLTQPRGTWYLDLIPLDARPLTGHPVDVSSHHDVHDQDEEDPGNMVRLNITGGGLSVAYFDANRNSSKLDLQAESTVCGVNHMGPTAVDFGVCQSGAEHQTPGLSPLPQLDIALDAIPNVRRQWRVEITDSRLRVFVDGHFVASANLPAAFLNQRRYTVHSTLFSYSTTKQWDTVRPTVHFVHWDNFGFTGPRSQVVVNNYLESQQGLPVFGKRRGDESANLSGDRSTVIEIPDQIGDLIDGKAQLYFTIQPTGFNHYTPGNDTVTVNGRTYQVGDPFDNMNNPPNRDRSTVSISIAVDINRGDLRTGRNDITFGFPSHIAVSNVHLELPYRAGTAPDYTSPMQHFGPSHHMVVMPAMTTCDYYWYIERDLGLPYQPGKHNVDPTDGCLPFRH